MSEPTSAEAPSWRSLAVSRSVDPAREAAEERVQRFIDAALELLGGPTGGDFTVQQVVERSGQSLRSFYHHFAGKYELMLALFEETIRNTADELERSLAPIDDPLERVQLFVTEYYRMCRSGEPHHSEKRLPTRAIGGFAHQLLFDHPTEASRAFVPLVSLLTAALRDAADAGAIRSDLDHEQVAGIVLQAIMFNTFATTVTGSPTDEIPGRGALLWQLLLGGLLGGSEER